MDYFADQLLAIRAPTSTSADTVTYTYCAYAGEFYCMYQGIKKATVHGVPWTYSGTSNFGGPFMFINLSATRPDGVGQGSTQQVSNTPQGPLLSYSDGIGLRTFSFEYSMTNRLSGVTLGDGNKLSYVYDEGVYGGRGNITTETHTPTPGSPLAPTVRLANYDATCTNPVKCNQPNWVRDAKGSQTDYTYDPTHGGVLSVTSPADAAGVRPQVRYSYVQRYAGYKNSSGAIVQAASPLWVLATEKFCRQNAACAGTADEVTKTYDYGPSSGANNLFLRGVAVSAEGVTLRICYGYDIYGNRISETAPKAGLASCP
jgi:hypothetical protein